MEPTQQLSSILPALSALVDRIHPRSLSDQTPCTAFKVRDVLDHMIVLGGTFAYLFRGEEPPEITAPETLGWVPAREFRATMDDLLAAVQSDGAMERIVPSPVGAMPGDQFARLVAFDGLVHGWDLATATGLDFELPSDVVAAVDVFARQALTAELRDGDTFKEATVAPVGASPMDAIAAFSGRTVPAAA